MGRPMCSLRCGDPDGIQNVDSLSGFGPKLGGSTFWILPEVWVFKKDPLYLNRGGGGGSLPAGLGTPTLY